MAWPPASTGNIQLKDLGGGVYGSSDAQDPTTLPLATWDAQTFQYAGAFRLPDSAGTSGGYTYSDGVMGLSPTSGNMYMSLHAVSDKGIGEIQIPALSTNTDLDLATLSYATAVQPRLDVIDGVSNPQENNKVSGMYNHSGDLIVANCKTYDADAANTQFMVRVDDPSDFSTTTMEGYYEIAGAYKSSSWFSAVPAEWQSLLGYEVLIGSANNWSIISRASVGPTAYGIDLDDISGSSPSSLVPTEAFMSYSLVEGEQLQQQVNPLWDLENDTLDNDVFTIVSRCSYGFIIPGTRTYAVFGYSEGHEDGVQYKGYQDDGAECPGYCSPSASDWSHFRWFFDVNDFLEVKNGTKQPHELIPYEYGPINTPFENLRGPNHELIIRGGVFDPDIGRLYLSITDADNLAGAPKPLVFAYDINIGS